VVDLRRAIFLDRDGVVNKAIVKNRMPFAPRAQNELIILDGVREAVDLFRQQNFELVVVTNQPDLARGKIDLVVLEQMHETIRKHTGITHFYVCGHDELEKCKCRKPKTGLIERAAQELGLDCKLSYMVGDRWKDISAGQKMGCECFFIDYNYDERRPDTPYFTVASLLKAAEVIRERV
jgi:D-glycero-D-manno-heptose 1,7-bisphosphate phosphatase